MTLDDDGNHAPTDQKNEERIPEDLGNTSTEKEKTTSAERQTTSNQAGSTTGAKDVGDHLGNLLKSPISKGSKKNIQTLWE